MKTTKITKKALSWLLVLLLFVSYAPIAAFGDDAEESVSQIIEINEGQSVFEISSLINYELQRSDYVTVVGSKTNADSTLVISIPYNKNLIWQAEYATNQGQVPIYIFGDGVFTLGKGGSITNVYSTIVISDGVHLIIDGGRVMSANDHMITVHGARNEVTINSGEVITTGEVMIGQNHAHAIFISYLAGSSPTITINGGTLVSRNGRIVHQHDSRQTNRVIINGGLLVTQGSSFSDVVNRDINADYIFVGEEALIIAYPHEGVFDGDTVVEGGFIMPLTARVTWSGGPNGNQHGIDYDNGVISGFFETSGPTVVYPPRIISFDLNGGSGGTFGDQVVNHGNKVTDPGIPSHAENYVFIGWFDAKEGGAVWNFAANTVTGDMTLYAGWEAPRKGLSLILPEEGFDFGYAVYGEEVPSARTFTLVNTGNVMVTLMYYIVYANGINFDSSIVFYVPPAVGPDAGDNKVTLGKRPGARYDVGNYMSIFRIYYKTILDEEYILLDEQIEATFEVKPRPLIITPDADIEKRFRQQDPEFTFTYTGNLPGETPAFAGLLSRISGESVGIYPITLGSLTLVDNGSFRANNYALVLNPTTAYFRIIPCKDVLRGVLADAEDLAGENFSASNWRLFVASRSHAQNVYSNVDATQAEIDNATNNLRNLVNRQIL